MVQWVKVLAAKLDDLSWIPGTYTVGENPLPQSFSYPRLHTHML